MKLMLTELGAVMRMKQQESFALIVVRPARTARGDYRLLVQSVRSATDGQYEVRSEWDVRPTGAFRLPLQKRRDRRDWLSFTPTAILASTAHPNFLKPQPLALYAADRVRGIPHVALSASPTSRLPSHPHRMLSHAETQQPL